MPFALNLFVFWFVLGRYRLTKILAKNKQSKRGEGDQQILVCFLSGFFTFHPHYAGTGSLLLSKHNSL